MKNILIIGANGFTGRQILNDLSQLTTYKVTGSSLHPDIQPKHTTNYNFIETDIRDLTATRRLFETVRPDVVINNSALSVPDYCEQHREEAYQMNVTAVEQLAHLCEAYNSRFIHLSTDFVFDGQATQLYTEEDSPAPVNYYGYTKWKGEERVADICHSYAIARVAIVYGKTLPGQHGNIVELVMKRLLKGEEIRVVSDQWRTPTHVEDVSQGVSLLIENMTNGIFHICGNDCLTIADTASLVARYMGADQSLIHPVTTNEMNEATPRPRFSGMRTEKARRILNYSPRSMEEGIKQVIDELNHPPSQS